MKKWLVSFFAVAVIATFVFLPSMQAITKFDDPASKREEMRQKLDALKAEIDANGYTFTVGYNPAMQYSIDQLCTFNPDMQLPNLHAVKSEPIAMTESLPAAYTGIWSPIKNQGSCGSCWAFSICAQFETAILKKDGVTVDLSEQNLVSCNNYGWGCNGGLWANDMFVSPGAVLESCFPYVAQDVPCQTCPYVYNASGWGFVEAQNVLPSVDNIKNAIYTYGAVSAAVFVDSNFQAYTSGVMNSCRRRTNRTNHAIQLCGWDDAKQAWLLKNSWGTGWGENGFMWIAYNCNLVGYGANYMIY
jgi:C1A family cysteine protease